MFETKSVAESRVVTRRIVMPDELNPNGTLFGGVLMSWIDMAALMCSQRHSGTMRVVTASVDRLDFLSPVALGDHVSIAAELEHVGKSSMAIRVAVDKQRPGFPEERVAITYLTLVALDSEGIPRSVPEIRAESEAERLLRSEAALRSRLLKRFRKWFQVRQDKLLRVISGREGEEGLFALGSRAR